MAEALALSSLSSLASLGLPSLAVNFGSSAYSARKAYKYQKKLMNHQYNLTRQLNQNAYQDTTYSMRQAGINPMLAITQGINNLSAGSGGSVGVSAPQFDLASSALDYLAYKNNKKATESQVDVNNSAIKLNDYLSDKAHAESAYTTEQNRQLQDYGPLRAQAEIAQINAGTAKVLNDMKNQNLLTNSQVNLNNNSAQSIKREYDLQSSWDKNNPKLKDWATGYRRFGFGGSVSVPIRK